MPDFHSITGTTGSSNALQISSANVTVEDSNISNNAQLGIRFDSGSAAAALVVRNSVLDGNAGGGAFVNFNNSSAEDALFYGTSITNNGGVGARIGGYSQ